MKNDKSETKGRKLQCIPPVRYVPPLTDKEKAEFRALYPATSDTLHRVHEALSR